jgi:hypothetical protein
MTQGAYKDAAVSGRFSLCGFSGRCEFRWVRSSPVVLSSRSSNPLVPAVKIFNKFKVAGLLCNFKHLFLFFELQFAVQRLVFNFKIIKQL